MRRAVPAADSIQAHLAKTRLAPLHREWLPAREAGLVARLRAVPAVGARNILLLNATKGAQFYASTIDFFVQLRRAQPSVRVTSASYFAEIHEFGPGVVEKGLPVWTVAQVDAATTDMLNQYELVLAFGPSEALFRLCQRPGLRAQVVLVDLGFYHQVLDAEREGGSVRPEPCRPAGLHPVVGYSCQAERKVIADFSPWIVLDRVDWRWFNYIPIGFRYANYYRTEHPIYDIALLGSSGRDYRDLDPRRLRGKKILFLGDASNALNLAPGEGQWEITFAPRLSSDAYLRMLALCRCVVLPMRRFPIGKGEISLLPDNVLLSVVDALASGVPIITPLRGGMLRLIAQQAPITVYNDGNNRWSWLKPPPAHLANAINSVLQDESRRIDLSRSSITFARGQMDMYTLLETIWREQIAPATS